MPAWKRHFSRLSELPLLECPWIGAFRAVVVVCVGCVVQSVTGPKWPLWAFGRFASHYNGSRLPP